MSENRSIFFIGIKELIGNLTPAYLIVLIGLYLTNKLTDTPTAISYLFFAGLIAIGMSAIQPYFLKVIIRPNRYLQLLAESSIVKILSREDFNLVKKSKKKRVNITETEKNFKKSYLNYLKSSIEEFWERRERLRGPERQFYEIKEGRLFLFFYLSALFLILTIISFVQNWSGQYYLKKIELISSTNPEIINYSIIGFGLLTAIFGLGFYHEFKRYTEIIFEEIPVIAATEQKNDIDIVRREIQYLENKKNDISLTLYNQLKQELEQNLNRIQRIIFQKECIINKVHDDTQISIDEIQKISNDISERISKSTFFSFSRLSLLITTLIFTLIAIYIEVIPMENIFFLSSANLVASILIILIILSGILLFSKFRFLLFSSYTNIFLLLISTLSMCLVLYITFFTTAGIPHFSTEISFIGLLGIMIMLVGLMLSIIIKIIR